MKSISIPMPAILVWLGMACWVCGQTDSLSLTPEQTKYFESQVRPLLVEHCYACHSVEAGLAEGGLSLDTRDGIRTGGSSGPAVVPGNVGSSLLMTAIRQTKPEFAMPPPDAADKLPEESIAILEKWIKQGAPDPRTEKHKHQQHEAYEAAKQWWAYQPIQRPEMPNPKNRPWARNEIDLFVLTGYEKNSVQPATDAPSSAMLRRLFYDLIGLPPTPEEYLAFQKILDDGFSLSDATAHIADRLLRSEQFGIHWGRHWLDVARFAESTGRESNSAYPHAWRYRDYVIDAWNSNTPYDQFLREQIAGDLLALGNDDSVKRRIATGFLAIGSKDLSQRDPKQFAVEVADEQIDTVFQAAMGLTVACARCHDHKFDPIPQRDYTAIAGIFLSTETKFGGASGPQVRNTSRLTELPRGTAPVVSTSEIDPSTRKKMQEDLENLKRDLAESIRARDSDPKKGVSIQRLTAQIGALESDLNSYDSNGRPLVLAMGVSDRPTASATPPRFMARKLFRRPNPFDSIVDSPLFVRGDIEMAGSTVPRGLLTMFESSSEVSISQRTSGRLELANWITSAENPMTARVAVNRIWYWLFGQGIVTSLDNFGTTGSTPSHPELLDYLASELIRTGWDTKAMIRKMVTSRAYQLSSEYQAANFSIDPENRWLWRANVKRLPAEAIRDGILSAAGNLDGRPQIGSLIAQEGEGVIGGRGRGLSEKTVVSHETQHRSIYLPLARNVVPEILETFDLPDASSVQTQREATNVPSQSLYLLNSPFVASQAEDIANRLVRLYPGDSQQNIQDRLNMAYQLLLSRNPSKDELLSARKLIAKLPRDALTAWTSVARSLIATAEFRYLD